MTKKALRLEIDKTFVPSTDFVKKYIAPATEAFVEKTSKEDIKELAKGRAPVGDIVKLPAFSEAREAALGFVEEEFTSFSDAIVRLMETALNMCDPEGVETDSEKLVVGFNQGVFTTLAKSGSLDKMVGPLTHFIIDKEGQKAFDDLKNSLMATKDYDPTVPLATMLHEIKNILFDIDGTRKEMSDEDIVKLIITLKGMQMGAMELITLISTMQVFQALVVAFEKESGVLPNEEEAIDMVIHIVKEIPFISMFPDWFAGFKEGGENE